MVPSWSITDDPSDSEFDLYLKQQYENLQVSTDGSKPPFDVYKRGMVGYLNLKSDGQPIANEKITLIDFRMSSRKKRMWVLDLKLNQVIYHRLVAHGKNTGEEYARQFSNTKNSNQSSLGFYITGENYFGKHGISLRLDGMEAEFNSKARSRAIVMHGASYVSKDFINTHGRLGRSFGCPAIALYKHTEIIKTLANGSVLFIYYPLRDYETRTLLNDSAKAWNYLQSLTQMVKS